MIENEPQEQSQAAETPIITSSPALDFFRRLEERKERRRKVKKKTIEVSSKVYDIVEEAFFQVGFCVAYLSLVFLLFFIGIISQAQGGYGFFIPMILMLWLILLLFKYKNAYYWIHQQVTGKENRKLLKNIIGIIIMIKICTTTGTLMGTLIGDLFYHQIIDLNHLNSIFEGIVEGLFTT